MICNTVSRKLSLLPVEPVSHLPENRVTEPLYVPGIYAVKIDSDPKILNSPMRNVHFLHIRITSEICTSQVITGHPG